MSVNFSTEVICVAEFKPLPGKTEELVATLSELIPLTKQESGCIRYELHQGIEDPNIITFIDRFKDEAAFNFHCETTYIKKYFDDILPNLVEDIKITLYRELIFPQGR